MLWALASLCASRSAFSLLSWFFFPGSSAGQQTSKSALGPCFNHALNFLWARRFWMRRRSSGSVTSAQSSVFDFDFDFDFEECCFLEPDSDGFELLEDIANRVARFRQIVCVLWKNDEPVGGCQKGR